jgi:hypothetical protein
MLTTLTCPECWQEITQYLNEEWDGKCPICSCEIAVPAYAFGIIVRDGETFVTKIKKIAVHINVTGQEGIDKVNDNEVCRMRNGEEILYVCKKIRKLEFILLGWTDACNFLIQERGYRKDYWSKEGIIQYN